MIKQAILTGGTGVTGNALIRYLLQQNIAVTALIRPDSFRRSSLPEEHELLTIVECGLENYESITPSLQRGSYDAFFHLAWDGSTGKQKLNNRNNFKLQLQNASYAMDAVQLCHAIACPTFVMTGSQAEYGRKDTAITEVMEKHPENGYGMAKLCAEGMTRILCKQYGIRHVWPILFSVYGPYDGTESLIDSCIHRLLRQEELEFTAGEQQWDYLYSYDAAKALLLLAEKGKDGECYNVTNGTTKPLREYIEIMYRIIAPDRKPNFGTIPYAPNQVMLLSADISKLKIATGFEPEYEFEEGIRQILVQIEETFKLQKRDNAYE